MVGIDRSGKEEPDEGISTEDEITRDTHPRIVTTHHLFSPAFFPVALYLYWIGLRGNGNENPRGFENQTLQCYDSIRRSGMVSTIPSRYCLKALEK